MSITTILRQFASVLALFIRKCYRNIELLLLHTCLHITTFTLKYHTDL